MNTRRTVIENCQSRSQRGLRGFVVDADKEIKEWEDYKKAIAAKAVEDKQKKRAAFFGGIIWFVVLSHTMMLIEYLLVWRRFL